MNFEFWNVLLYFLNFSRRSEITRLSFKIFLLVCFVILLSLSCAPSNQNNTSQNNPPLVAFDFCPEDLLVDVILEPSLMWDALDPDQDTLVFDIYFGTNTTPPIREENYTQKVYTPGVLLENTTYYWKIVAKDGKGGFSESSVLSFTTKQSGLNWKYVFGSNSDDKANSIIKTKNGGFVVAGITYQMMEIFH